VTPEEYQALTQFVDRVERGLIRQIQAEIKQKEERDRYARSIVSEEAFSITLEELGLSERVFNLLSEAGYQNVGDLKFQMVTDPDSILGLSGIGPKAMLEIETTLAALPVLQPKEEVPAESVVEAEEGIIEAVEEAPQPTPEVVEEAPAVPV